MRYNENGVVEAESKKEMYKELCKYGTINGTELHRAWCNELIEESKTFDFQQAMKGETIKLVTK